MNTFKIVALTWKPKQMVGMTLNMEAQELILQTDRRQQSFFTNTIYKYHNNEKKKKI